MKKIIAILIALVAIGVFFVAISNGQEPNFEVVGHGVCRILTNQDQVLELPCVFVEDKTTGSKTIVIIVVPPNKPV